MKIVFIVACLKHGEDGVGDYVRRLSGELVSLGHECFNIAINDNKLTIAECRDGCDVAVAHGADVLRVSGRQRWEPRLDMVSEAIRECGPDWISLQYVPWGYDLRGLPWQLPGRLSKITRHYPLHIMCHELWMEGSLFPIRKRLIGALQKRLFRRLFNVLRPQVVHTQIALYRDMLSNIGVRSEVLPLHGNIPVCSSRADGHAWMCERIGSRASDLCLGFFGEVHASLDAGKVADLAAECARQASPSWILSAGALSAESLAVWEGLKQYFTAKTRFLQLGRMEEREVSCYLSGLNLGLTSYPLEYVGKSGGVAAMLEHGLAVRLLGRSLGGATETREDLLSPRYAASVSATAKRFTATLTSRALAQPVVDPT